jgi:formylglycine-generating enzyme required for sulfatase activity
MPFHPGPAYWLEIPAGRYRVGLTPDEARRLAAQSAAWLNKRGPEFSLNDAKMLGRAAELATETGNSEWVERYLLAHHPAREVELRGFAIARRPLTNREYRAFMADTGETQTPEAWRRGTDDRNHSDDAPAQGLCWWLADALARWAGARLPFEDEWERAVRGPEHSLFPWGDTFEPIGAEIVTDGYQHVIPTATTRNRAGLEGANRASPEWCADLWTAFADPAVWGDPAAPAWWRVVRGGVQEKRVIPSAVFRAPARSSYNADTASVRLVRADGRRIPDAPMPTEEHAMRAVRSFESRVLGGVYAALESSQIGEDHSLFADWSGSAKRDPGGLKVSLAVRRGVPNIRAGLPTDPNTWVDGLALIAFSRETIRRVPREHGVFIWVPQYRLAADGVRVRSVTAFRMAFDKSIHRFENRLRADEADTKVGDLTPDIVRTNILDTFHYYEIHADSEANPFSS